jgi:hypothetical protein
VLSEKQNKFEDNKKDLELMNEEKKGLILEMLLRKLFNAQFSGDITNALKMEQ